MDFSIFQTNPRLADVFDTPGFLLKPAETGVRSDAAAALQIALKEIVARMRYEGPGNGLGAGADGTVETWAFRSDATLSYRNVAGHQAFRVTETTELVLIRFADMSCLLAVAEVQAETDYDCISFIPLPMMLAGVTERDGKRYMIDYPRQEHGNNGGCIATNIDRFNDTLDLDAILAAQVAAIAAATEHRRVLGLPDWARVTPPRTPAFVPLWATEIKLYTDTDQKILQEFAADLFEAAMTEEKSLTRSLSKIVLYARPIVAKTLAPEDWMDVEIVGYQGIQRVFNDYLGQLKDLARAILDHPDFPVPKLWQSIVTSGFQEKTTRGIGDGSGPAGSVVRLSPPRVLVRHAIDADVEMSAHEKLEARGRFNEKWMIYAGETAFPENAEKATT